MIGIRSARTGNYRLIERRIRFVFTEHVIISVCQICGKLNGPGRSGRDGTGRDGEETGK